LMECIPGGERRKRGAGAKRIHGEITPENEGRRSEKFKKRNSVKGLSTVKKFCDVRGNLTEL